MARLRNDRTASTEAEEFMSIYKLEVVVIPTNQPCIREDSKILFIKQCMKICRHNRRNSQYKLCRQTRACWNNQHRKKRNAVRGPDKKIRRRARSSQRQTARTRGYDCGKGRLPAHRPDGKACGNVTIAIIWRPWNRYQARTGRCSNRRFAYSRHGKTRGPKNR